MSQDVLPIADLDLAEAPIEEEKPRRGRRRRGADFVAPEASPQEAVSLEGEAADKPRRGRRKASDTAAESIADIKALLLSTHAMLASVTQTPELVLDEKEAEMLGGALARFAAHYKIGLTGKRGALIGLIYAAGVVYLPRMVVIARKAKTKAPAKPASTSSIVSPPSPPPSAPPPAPPPTGQGKSLAEIMGMMPSGADDF